MTLETEEQKIARRSRNADAVVFGAIGLFDWICLITAALFLLALLLFWLFGQI